MSTEYCFDIDTAEGYYRKLLKPAVDDFMRDRTSSPKALTSSLFLWHFTEWVVESHPAQLKKLGLGLCSIEALRKHMVSKYPGYAYLEMVANGAKHCRVDNKKLQGVKATELSHGFYNPLGVTESHLVLKMKDGTTRFIDYDIVNSMKEWESFIGKNLGWQP